MKHDDIDDLDRALFALPLAEPPAGLRASIFRATVYAPSAAQAFGRLEMIAIGVMLALASWLTLATVMNPRAAGSIEGALAILVRGLADPQTLVWLGVGALTAVWLSVAGFAPFRFPNRPGRAS
jgi:hypothetical protein